MTEFIKFEEAIAYMRDGGKAVLAGLTYRISGGKIEYLMQTNGVWIESKMPGSTMASGSWIKVEVKKYTFLEALNRMAESEEFEMKANRRSFRWSENRLEWKLLSGQWVKAESRFRDLNGYEWVDADEQ